MRCSRRTRNWQAKLRGDTLIIKTFYYTFLYNVYFYVGRLEIKSKATLILAELLFSANIISEVRKYRTLFLRFTHDDSRAQRYLLFGLEQIVALHKVLYLKKIFFLLKTIYF